MLATLIPAALGSTQPSGVCRVSAARTDPSSVASNYVAKGYPNSRRVCAIRMGGRSTTFTMSPMLGALRSPEELKHRRENAKIRVELPVAPMGYTNRFHRRMVLE